MKHLRSTALLGLALILLVTGCGRVHYRFHDFEHVIMMSGETSLALALNGTPHVEDSAGYHIERRTSPYRLRIYITPPDGVVEIQDLRLIGTSTGLEVRPRLSPLRPLDGDTLGRIHAVAYDLNIPYEDYAIELRLKVRNGATATETNVTGIIRRQFQSQEKNRFWERLMSI